MWSETVWFSRSAMTGAEAEHTESLLCLWELSFGLALSLLARSWSEQAQTRSSLAFLMLWWPVVGWQQVL